MSSPLWLIWVGLSSLIFILVWVSYKWGKTSHKKETLNESVKIKDIQFKILFCSPFRGKIAINTKI